MSKPFDSPTRKQVVYLASLDWEIDTHLGNPYIEYGDSSNAYDDFIKEEVSRAIDEAEELKELIEISGALGFLGDYGDKEMSVKDYYDYALERIDDLSNSANPNEPKISVEILILELDFAFRNFYIFGRDKYIPQQNKFPSSAQIAYVAILEHDLEIKFGQSLQEEDKHTAKTISFTIEKLVEQRKKVGKKPFRFPYEKKLEEVKKVAKERVIELAIREWALGMKMGQSIVGTPEHATMDIKNKIGELEQQILDESETILKFIEESNALKKDKKSKSESTDASNDGEDPTDEDSGKDGDGEDNPNN